MIDYWAAHKGEFVAPARADIDPADFPDIITQVFMIGRERSGVYPIRLAGALMEDLHRRPLRNTDFMDLWTIGDRSRLQAAIEPAVLRGQALRAEALGRSLQGEEARLQIMMAPLTNGSGQIDRLLGFYQPISPLFRLQGQPIERLFLQDIAFAETGMATPAPLRIAAVDGRRLA
jgi:hypothetical protein